MRTVPHEPCSPTNVSRPASVPPPASPEIDDSSWKIAFSPPPSDSVPRTPRRDEFELRRVTLGRSPFASMYSSDRCKRPYNVTFAVCACAASGAARTAATATATSFLFMKSSPLTDNVGRVLTKALKRLPFAPPSKPSHVEFEKLKPLCQTRRR